MYFSSKTLVKSSFSDKKSGKKGRFYKQREGGYKNVYFNGEELTIISEEFLPDEFSRGNESSLVERSKVIDDLHKIDPITCTYDECKQGFRNFRKYFKIEETQEIINIYRDIARPVEQTGGKPSRNTKGIDHRVAILAYMKCLHIARPTWHSHKTIKHYEQLYPEVKVVLEQKFDEYKKRRNPK